MSLIEAAKVLEAFRLPTFSFHLDYKFDDKTGVYKKDMRLPKEWQKTSLDTPLCERVSNKHNALGIVTGPTSWSIVGDIDDVPQFEKYLKDINQEMPVTWTSKTGSGGLHLFFLWEPRFAQIKTSSKMITHPLTGETLDFDVRAENGFVVASPSQGMAGDKLMSYEWLPGLAPGEVELAKMPEWMFEALTQKVIGKRVQKPAITISYDTQTPKSDRDVNSKLADFILETYSILPDKLQEIKYFQESDTYCIGLRDKGCVFVKREHSNNHNYLIIKSDGTLVRKCHSKKHMCDSKEFRPTAVPSDIMNDLKATFLTNHVEVEVDEELKSDACTEATTFVKKFYPGNDNMPPAKVGDDKTISGVMHNFLGLRKCPSCENGNFVFHLDSYGYYIACDYPKCVNRVPGGDDRMPMHWDHYSKAQLYFQTVNVNNNIQIENNYYGSGCTKQELGWNEFLDDKIQIVDDPVLNTAIAKALSGTHQRLAELLYQINGNEIVHSKESKDKCHWFHFDSPVWKPIDHVIVKRLITGDSYTELFIKAKSAYQSASVKDKERKLAQIQKTITSLQNSQLQNSVVQQFETIARKDRTEFFDKLDKKRNLLGFTNGVLDLDSGVFRQGRPDDFITMTVGYAYDPNKMADKTITGEFYEFFRKVFPDIEVGKWVHKYLGSCLTGYTRDQIFVFGHGTGSNGKGILINIMSKVLGEFSAKIDASFLCGNMPDSERATPTLTRLIGKRFVYISETMDSAKLNEQLFKALCGEDKMPFRPLYGEQGEFMPDFKMFMVCNALPAFNGSDPAMKRRTRVIPFISLFKDAEECLDPSKNEFIKDPTLNDRIEDWKWVVMKFLIDGYHLYKREGLSVVPAKMKDITYQYLADNNIFDTARDELLIKNPTGFIEKEAYYDKFLNWLKINAPSEHKRRVESDKKLKENILRGIDVSLVGRMLTWNDRRYTSQGITYSGWKGWSFQH